VNKKNPRKGMIRKSIRAPQGYKVVKADASQIEARWNAWHNGQTDLVEMFARGEDIYSKFATDAYGRPIDRKARAEDELPGQVGKICILGLGYGMGWLKLAMELLMGRGGAPRIQFTRDDMERLQVDTGRFLANPRVVNQIKAMPSRLNEADRMVHCAVTNHFVETYRRKMKAIVDGWDYWEGVIQWMFSGEYRGPVGKHGVLTLVDDGLLHNATGLMLKYPHLEWSEGKGYSYLSGKNKRSKLYGGLVVENITQFCCRIVVFEAARRLTWGRTRAGLSPYKIAHREHDALLMTVPEELAGEGLNDLMRELTTTPAWAPGLPLAAEGGIGQTMGDAK
jgi:DNA polymerase